MYRGRIPPVDKTARKDTHHQGAQREETRRRLSSQKILECSSTAEAFLIASLLLLIAYKPLGFYDLQAIWSVLNKKKPR